MAAIDIGSGANYYNTFVSSRTLLDAANTANDTGVLDVFEVFFAGSNSTNVKIGTFSGSGTTYTNRDFETLGTVVYGSKQTFTGKNCDVSSGDLLGIYFSYRLRQNTTGGSGIYRGSGGVDNFDGEADIYTLQTDTKPAIYATGTTAGGASVWLPFMKHHLIGGF